MIISGGSIPIDVSAAMVSSSIFGGIAGKCKEILRRGFQGKTPNSTRDALKACNAPFADLKAIPLNDNI
jgi:hypothetical protein